MGRGQQCLCHIHAFCAVLQGGQRLSAFDFQTTFSSFSACIQPQRKTSPIHAAHSFPNLSSSTSPQDSSSAMKHFISQPSKISWDVNIQTTSHLLGTASQISTCGDANLFLSAKSYTPKPLLTSPS